MTDIPSCGPLSVLSTQLLSQTETVVHKGNGVFAFLYLLCFDFGLRKMMVFRIWVPDKPNPIFYPETICQGGHWEHG